MGLGILSACGDNLERDTPNDPSPRLEAPHSADAGEADGGEIAEADGGEITETDKADAGEVDDGPMNPGVAVAMTSFSFKAAVNDAIEDDVSSTISGTTIRVVLPYGTAATRLRASFVSTGSSVTVQGKAQISGATANDFSVSLEYVVHGPDNDAVVYTVIVTIAAGLRVDGHTPADNASGISVYASIELGFSNAVRGDSLDEDSVTVTTGSGPIYGSIINDPENQKLIFVPYGLLPEDSDLTVTVSGNIRSTTSLGLETDVVFMFRTGFYEPLSAGNLRVYSNFEAAYIRKDLDISFTTDVPGTEIETGWSKDLSATGPDEWSAGATFDFDVVDSYGTVKVFARAVDSGTTFGDNYTFIYKLVDAFPPASEKGRCDCVSGDDDAIVARAVSVDKIYGGQISDRWKYDSLDGFSPMGNGGVFDYFFDPPITDGVGADFVVGENGFRNAANGLIFAELFYVEVSSNGVDYLRFDSVSLTRESGSYLSIDPGEVYGLGSTQMANYGIDYRQPYDLAWLRNKREVIDGTIDLSSITRVRFVDIPGTEVEETYQFDGKTYVYSPQYDSFGNVIRDAYLTSDSGGADVFAPCALHMAKGPATSH